MIQQRQNEYKAMALNFKKQGKIPQARAMLATSKSLQTPIDMLSSGQQLLPSFVLPPPPSTVTLTTRNVEAAEVTSGLRNQITLFHKLSAFHLRFGRKEQALCLHKMKKIFQEALDHDITSESVIFKSKFIYEFEEIEPLVGADELEFCILNVAGEMPPKFSVELSILDQTYSSPLLTTMDVPWKQSVIFTRNRALHKSVDRKKVTLVLQKPKGGIFSFGAVEPFARCVFKLDELKKKARSDKTVDLTVPNKRKVIGAVDVSMAIRMPLESASNLPIKMDIISVGHDLGETIHILKSGVKIIPRLVPKVQDHVTKPTPTPEKDSSELVMQFNKYIPAFNL